MDDPSRLYELLVLAVSLVISGLFSSAETALTALPERRVKQLIQQDRKRYGPLTLWLEKPNEVLTTILIGNNIVNVFLSSYAALIAQRHYSNNGLTIAVFLTTTALLVVGEISPKTFAKHNAKRIAPILIRMIRMIHFAFRPIIWFFTMLSKSLVRIIGGDVTRTGPFVTEEDIEFLVEEGHKTGVLEEQEKDMITNIIDFGDTIVREIMVPRTEVEALKLDSTIDAVYESVKVAGHTRLPVFGDNIDDIRGIFHTRELLTLDEENFSLGNHLHKPFWVPELMKISELLKEFQRRKVHICVVVDEYGGTSGIVSLEDILEEIVGEIQDEYDEEEETDIRKVGADKFIATGKAALDDLEEHLDIEFPHPRAYETVGGFLTSELGFLPKQGMSHQFEGWLFIVREVDKRMIVKVQIDKISDNVSERPTAA